MKLPLSIIGKLFPKRIWQQILLILIILVVCPLVVLGTLLIRTSQNSIKTTVLRDYKQVAINATGRVKESIDSARQALQVTASLLGILHADAWRQETAIVELSLRYPVFRRISSIDLKGMEVATSELGTPLQDRADEEIFKLAKSGEYYVSDVTIAQDHMPILNMAVPIKQLGKVKGVLIAEVNIRGIWNVIDRIQFGKTGKAYLVDQEGRIIAHPDKKLILKGTEPDHSGIIQNVLSGHTESLEVKDKKGKPGYLVAFAPIESLHWGLIIEQSLNEALAFSKVMKTQSWVLIVISIIAAMILSFILASFMSHPMNKLIEATGRLAQGDFDHSFRIRRRDEIGRLLFSFNRMARKLQKAQQEEKLSIVGRAATTIAHELKNSLLLVNTFIQLLPKRHKDKKFIDEFSQTIPRELVSWNKMLKNMMDYSRLEIIPMEYFDINNFLKEIIALAKFRVAQKSIHFDVNITSDLPMISGNADKLKQVFLNLITNSIDATSSGGTILLEARYVESAPAWMTSYVEIRIANSGKGITITNLSRIFEPFYTTKDQGLGLGLSISKEIINQHGGRIGVISERNKGTSFAVQLPAVLQELEKGSQETGNRNQISDILG